MLREKKAERAGPGDNPPHNMPRLPERDVTITPPLIVSPREPEEAPAAGNRARSPGQAGARAGAAETDNGFQLPKKVVDAKRKVTISHLLKWNWMPLGAHVGWQ